MSEKLEREVGEKNGEGNRREILERKLEREIREGDRRKNGEKIGEKYWRRK